MTRKQRHQRTRKKVTDLFPRFTQAFSFGGLREAENVLKIECHKSPQEAHIARMAFDEIKTLAIKGGYSQN